ncbi:13198_t:CDS:2 [Racocetra fulgida]|uniref:13198_t:CDS:1 n=1 Tax=Racocetra fulgida TaxID=60492 RepID=A0A9N9F6X3_9GLOM|nr:13198_t:CDS:2 [Racocetra fulgida]
MSHVNRIRPSRTTNGLQNGGHLQILQNSGQPLGLQNTTGAFDSVQRYLDLPNCDTIKERGNSVDS